MWITQATAEHDAARVFLISEQQGIDATGQSGRVMMQMISP
jgi:hypothetical protein